MTSPSQTGTTIDLAWQAGNDQAQGATYNVYMDGELLVSGLTELAYTVTGLGPGETHKFQVSASTSQYAESEKTDELSVTTTVAVTGISLDKSTLSGTAGGTGQLHATVSPDNATDKDVEFSSSNEDVATVDNTGKVTYVAEGTATITVKAHGDETKTDTCDVTVAAAG